MFSGVYTAIVTPFTRNGAVDLEALARLINIQIEAGVDGIVPVGTTGESPTLDFEEHTNVIRATLAAAAGRVKVIAGTGGNATAEALHLTRLAQAAGADGTLQVTPYYNKPNQEGLYRHFSAVADVGLPVVLYNVPGRTSREIAVETVARLAEHPNVVAIKEAGGCAERVSEILAACRIQVLSGDDALTLPMMALGAEGVISVASNIIPGPIRELVHAALSGDWTKARGLHDHYFPLLEALFVDTNPIPVKAAMAMQGLIEESYRLPMCAMSDALRERLRGVMETVGLLP
ncbi:MAG: 4-hydroxy-tetrahydrodipicolinate synthase [Verrucomicrobia bacterium]|nr:4-hydroxy-tetrahydrodipicolinate synthase [Verrucomicrobiota bacterium]